MPSPDKYDKTKFNTYKEKVYEAKIHGTHLPRFKPIERKLDPSPATYNVPEAIDKSQWSSTRYSIG